MKLQKSKSLLEQALEIIDRRKPDSANPEFNIFTILGLERREVRTHSAFIYELINPEGSHYQGKAFLSLFIKHVLGRDDPCEGQLDVCRENSFEDGRIDFTIQTKRRFYAIEMKIDAGDQPGQLKRYYDYCKERMQLQFSLYYLTLDGRNASDISTEGLTDYYPIAFKAGTKDTPSVQKWLCECRKYLKCDTSPLALALSQYAEVIEKLTKEYEKDVEMMNLIKNSADWDAVDELVNARADIASQMLQVLLEAIKTRLENVCIDGLAKIPPTTEVIRAYCQGNKPYPGYLGLAYHIHSKFSSEKSPMWFIVEFGEGKLYCMASCRHPNGRPYTRKEIEEKNILGDYDERYKDKLLKNPSQKYLTGPSSSQSNVSFYYNVVVDDIELHFDNIKRLMRRDHLFSSDEWDMNQGNFFDSIAIQEICDAIAQSYDEFKKFLNT